MPVTAADYFQIADLIGRYCWYVDRGEIEDWLALWTEDGVFAGAMPDDVVGHNQLPTIPEIVKEYEPGTMRHISTYPSCDYLSSDIVRARYYNMVTVWSDKGELMVMTDAVATIVQRGGTWLFQKVDVIVRPVGDPCLTPIVISHVR